MILVGEKKRRDLVKEIYENAKNKMKGYCRVCPQCDGKACAGEVPGMGGFRPGWNPILIKLKLNWNRRWY
jgi:hypothetical protein